VQKIIFIYFIFINIAAFIVYTIDKARAKAGASRVSERELFTFSLLGGFLGATLSMALFRHKISKNSFLIKHIIILLLWIGVIVYYFTDFNELNFIR
jgi:uncharacterized membrane protein YsdA (DUF1294 family)